MEFRNVTVAGDEIHVFTEAKAELEIKPSQTATGGFSSMNSFAGKDQEYIWATFMF